MIEAYRFATWWRSLSTNFQASSIEARALLNVVLV